MSAAANVADLLDDLLKPEGAPISDPGQIERALALLWEPSAEGGDRVASRICVANLVIVSRAENWHGLVEVLADISPAYPTRTIVLLPGGDAITAFVSALCHVPQPHQPQVCCEQVVLRGGPADGRNLDRTLLPLLESDVPTMVWWVRDPADCPALLHSVRQRADRLILDAGRAGFAHLATRGRCAVRELGWYRTARWRQLIAGMFDGSGADDPNRIEHVIVGVGECGPDSRVDAVWMAAFLAGQLDWHPRKTVAQGVYELAAGQRLVKVELVPCNSRGGACRVVIVGGGYSYEIASCPHSPGEFQVHICDENTCLLPRCLESPCLSRKDALLAAMTGRFVDAAFARAAPIAAWMAEQVRAEG
ncbi:MAG: glucose-6-phosphate dehydrogenase assembly protein OpcA [Phycisphaerae bacterium]|nr:glucose-6-phosphate dehydrogenase assembly protein OpcA [Phycisphaerae bacterium]